MSSASTFLAPVNERAGSRGVNKTHAVRKAVVANDFNNSKTCCRRFRQTSRALLLNSSPRSELYIVRSPRSATGLPQDNGATQPLNFRFSARSEHCIEDRRMSNLMPGQCL